MILHAACQCLTKIPYLVLVLTFFLDFLFPYFICTAINSAAFFGILYYMMVLSFTSVHYEPRFYNTPLNTYSAHGGGRS